MMRKASSLSLVSLKRVALLYSLPKGIWRYEFSTVEQEEDIKRSLTRDTSLNQEQINKIVEADRIYRKQHLKVEDKLSSSERDAVRRRRMIYRSKQRGWLEVDILLGSWATKNVPKLSEQQLDEYEIVLKEETIDIYNFVSGKDPLPERLKNLSVMKMLQTYALESNIKDPEAYEQIKKETNLT